MKLDLTNKYDLEITPGAEFEAWNEFVNSSQRKKILNDALDRQRRNSYIKKTEDLREQDYWLVLSVARRLDFERTCNFLAESSWDFCQNSGFYDVPEEWEGRNPTAKEMSDLRKKRIKIFKNEALIAAKGLLDMIEFEVIPELND